jgi:hypothetical protein
MKSFSGCISVLAVIVMVTYSCRHQPVEVIYDFDLVNDRIWIGEDFYAVPLEEWCINDGRIEFTGEGQQATCAFLPYLIGSNGKPFRISMEMGLLDRGSNNGSAGLIIGSQAPEDDDIRAAIFFGSGINAGIHTDGYAFIGQYTKKIPAEFELTHFILVLTGAKNAEGFILRLNVLDTEGNSITEVAAAPEAPVAGILQLVANPRSARSRNNGPRFWFDNIKLEGPGFKYEPENRFGPVLWSMHTLSNNILKMTAQLPPISEMDNQIVELEFKTGKKWVSAGSKPIDPDSRTATFRLENWDPLKEKEYRILYRYRNLPGNEEAFSYSGSIRKEPAGRPLRMGAMTCQYHTGFPYSPVIRNLGLRNPDILYFSGDQIYEQNGGYPIKREPVEMAILSYLGKWYMFGWAFGDIMRDIPTICTPDDHDVFQGNLWGGGGMARPSGTANSDDLMGFTQTVKMVNVVNITQCSHLPDPFYTAPIEQGMRVWYTSLNYGRVSFAIVSDRVFKSGPDLVATWEGRKDHLKEQLSDPSVIDMPELDLLGERQELFLESWIRDWKDADMKVLLSQTPFANAATHHGQQDGYLLGDLDSGGWPRKARDRAIGIIRKAFVFHIAGDQHLPSLIQYGIENFRDAGWSFCTPAIAVGYSRWFRPDELSIPVSNRPQHNLPNTGEYTDAFGNKNYIYAIGNPGDFGGISNRYKFQQEKTAGLGFVVFDTETRNITMESWRFLSDVTKPDRESQHPGWPLTISQMDNYGREPVAWLPTLKISGDPDPIVEVVNQSTGELEYIVRIKGNEFIPKVFSNDKFIVKVGYPEKNLIKEYTDIIPHTADGGSELVIDFN